MQEQLVAERMREKLRHGCMALGLEVMVRDHVNTAEVHLHRKLELGVINWVCSHRHADDDAADSM
jgi:hypothetical protein